MFCLVSVKKDAAGMNKMVKVVCDEYFLFKYLAPTTSDICIRFMDSIVKNSSPNNLSLFRRKHYNAVREDWIKKSLKRVERRYYC